MKAKTTLKTLPLVLARLTVYGLETVQESKDVGKLFCADLDRFLDQLSDQDAFGTEGQNDPRGDQRD